MNDFNKFGRTYQVKVQAESGFRASPDDIKRLEVRNNHGEMIPPSTLVDVRETLGPQLVTRYDMCPSALINGVAAPGHSSGDALAMMEQMAARKLPQSTGFEWTETSYQEKATGGQAPYVFALAVLFVPIFFVVVVWLAQKLRPRIQH